MQRSRSKNISFHPARCIFVRCILHRASVNGLRVQATVSGNLAVPSMCCICLSGLKQQADHNRTGTPRSARYCFICRMVNLPKWAIDATSTASA